MIPKKTEIFSRSTHQKKSFVAFLSDFCSLKFAQKKSVFCAVTVVAMKAMKLRHQITIPTSEVDSQWLISIEKMKLIDSKYNSSKIIRIIFDLKEAISSFVFYSFVLSSFLFCIDSVGTFFHVMSCHRPQVVVSTASTFIHRLSLILPLSDYDPNVSSVYLLRPSSSLHCHYRQPVSQSVMAVRESTY